MSTPTASDEKLPQSPDTVCAQAAPAENTINRISRTLTVPLHVIRDAASAQEDRVNRASERQREMEQDRDRFLRQAGAAQEAVDRAAHQVNVERSRLRSLSAVLGEVA